MGWLTAPLPQQRTESPFLTALRQLHLSEVVPDRSLRDGCSRLKRRGGRRAGASSLPAAVRQRSAPPGARQPGGRGSAVPAPTEELGQALQPAQARPPQPPTACPADARPHGGHATARLPAGLIPMKPAFRPAAGLWLTAVCPLCGAGERQPPAPGQAGRRGLGAAQTPRPWAAANAPRPSKASGTGAARRGGGEPAGPGRGPQGPEGAGRPSLLRAAAAQPRGEPNRRAERQARGLAFRPAAGTGAPVTPRGRFFPSPASGCRDPRWSR